MQDSEIIQNIFVFLLSMHQPKVTYFLIFLFVMSIAIPSVVTYMNLNLETAELIDKSEEEENKGKESSADEELKILYQHFNYGALSISETNKEKSIYLALYQNTFVKVVSPPPELSF